jgi:hypothetical protein
VEAVPAIKIRSNVQVVNGKLECNICLEVKLVEEFYKNAHRKSGYHSACKECFNARESLRAKDTPEEIRLDRFLRHKFNITYAQYMTVFIEQDGVCAICKQPETVKKNSDKIVALAVDHNHACCPGTRSCGKTGCVRRLLCTLCNHAIGVIERVGSIEPFRVYLETTFEWPEQEEIVRRAGSGLPGVSRPGAFSQPTDRQPNRGLTDGAIEFTCALCREVLPMEQAYQVSVGDGKYRRTGRCIECTKKKQKIANDKMAAKRRGPDYVKPVIKDHIHPVVDGQRVCLECEENKPVSSFYEDRSVFSGYQTVCKDCKRAARR